MLRSNFTRSWRLCGSLGIFAYAFGRHVRQECSRDLFGSCGKNNIPLLYQVLEFAGGHGFWNVCDILYYDAVVCMEGIVSRLLLRRALSRYKRRFYRCVEITLECLPLAELTCTAVLPPFLGKNSKTVRDRLFSVCVL
jgi:hypothetical protein